MTNSPTFDRINQAARDFVTSMAKIKPPKIEIRVRVDKSKFIVGLETVSLRMFPIRRQFHIKLHRKISAKVYAQI